MSVTNGQIANQTTFNNAFPSRTVDTSMAGKLNMSNTTEAGNDAGALRVQGGMYVAKKVYAKELIQALKGFAVEAVSDAAATGTSQEVTLTKPFTVFSNAGLVSVQALDFGTQTFAGIIFIKNNTGDDVVLVNNTGTAGKRISTGTGKDLTMKNTSIVMLIYDTINSIWCISGGSGSGGGGAGQVDFPLANNTTADVTGLIFDNTLVRSALVNWCITRITTGFGATARVQRGSFMVVWDGTAWTLTPGADSGVDSGVVLDIDPTSGQVFYDADIIAGTPSISTLSYNIVDQTEGV